MRYKPITAGYIITSCAIVYNIMKNHNVPLATSSRRVIQEPPHREFVGNINYTTRGQQTRTRVIQMLNEN